MLCSPRWSAIRFGWKDLFWYEVIPAESPCNLYFDIEFARALNPNADGDAMVDLLQEKLIEFVLNKLELVLTKSDVIDLTSSTGVKFSRHLIIHLPGAVFLNNRHCGFFVRSFCAHLRRSGDGTSSLFVSTKGGKTCLFVDEAVYTRNRCFRLLGSSKLKKLCENRGAFLSYVQNQARQIASSVSGGGASSEVRFAEWKETLVCAVQVGKDTRVIRFSGGGTSTFLRGNNSETKVHKAVFIVLLFIESSFLDAPDEICEGMLL